MLRYAVTVTFDPSSLNICYTDIMWPNLAPNVNEIDQSAAEL